MGISRTLRWNVWNEGHEWANHPLKAALISNYLIKICLRRGASYAPFELVLHLLLLSKNIVAGGEGEGSDLQGRGERVEGRSNELTTRHEKPKRDESAMHMQIYMSNKYMCYDAIKYKREWPTNFHIVRKDIFIVALKFSIGL